MYVSNKFDNKTRMSLEDPKRLPQLHSSTNAKFKLSKDITDSSFPAQKLNSILTSELIFSFSFFPSPPSLPSTFSSNSFPLQPLRLALVHLLRLGSASKHAQPRDGRGRRGRLIKRDARGGRGGRQPGAGSEEQKGGMLRFSLRQTLRGTLRQTS